MYKKSPICNDIKHIMKQIVSTSKIQCLTPFLKIYKRMITKKLYSKLRIINESISYITKYIFHKFWMDTERCYNASPINILIDFSDFIENNIKLQNIKLEGFPKKIIPIIQILNNFQYSPSHIGIKL